MEKNGTSSPLVSVVMCTYNADKYIKESIDSILSQTYSNYEFIIWDDGSTDSTKEIVASYQDDRIHYFYHENTGLGMALRLACEKATGKYIARMDSDDICFPERLETELHFLEEHNDHVLVSSAVFEINEKGEKIRRTFPINVDFVLKEILKEPANMIVHPMVMMRSEAYNKAGGYLPIRKSQDVLFWSRLAKQGKFYNISKPLGYYRIVSSSLDHSINPYKPVLSALLRKMVQDEVVLDTDIDLYNYIFVYSKQFINKDCTAKVLNKLPLESRFFNTIRLLLGEDVAAAFIIKLKNIYYRCKLHK